MPWPWLFAVVKKNLFMTNFKNLKIVHVVAEVSPYSKVGGLGDVGYALPKAISRLSHETIIISPYYGCVRAKNIKREKIEGNFKIQIAGTEYPVNFYKHVSPDNVPIYFIVNEEFFGGHQGIYRVMEVEAMRWIFFDPAARRILRMRYTIQSNACCLFRITV